MDNRSEITTVDLRSGYPILILLNVLGKWDALEVCVEAFWRSRHMIQDILVGILRSSSAFGVMLCQVGMFLDLNHDGIRESDELVLRAATGDAVFLGINKNSTMDALEPKLSAAAADGSISIESDTANTSSDGRA